MKRTQTQENERTLYRAATTIIRHRYRWPGLSLRYVADELAVSPRQLQRVFRSEGETTFRAHLLGVRMTHARRILEAGGSNRQAAVQVGYSHWAGGFAQAYRRWQKEKT